MCGVVVERNRDFKLKEREEGKRRNEREDLGEFFCERFHWLLFLLVLSTTHKIVF
jgi:hypothetical protein